MQQSIESAAPAAEEKKKKSNSLLLQLFYDTTTRARREEKIHTAHRNINWRINGAISLFDAFVVGSSRNRITSHSRSTFHFNCIAPIFNFPFSISIFNFILKLNSVCCFCAVVVQEWDWRGRVAMAISFLQLWNCVKRSLFHLLNWEKVKAPGLVTATTDGIDYPPCLPAPTHPPTALTFFSSPLESTLLLNNIQQQPNSEAQWRQGAYRLPALRCAAASYVELNWIEWQEGSRALPPAVNYQKKISSI